MPNIYLRVPHYVASYFRNKNRSNRIEVGGVIRIDPSDPIYATLVDMATSNSTYINRGYCFSTKQWKRMMQGYSLRSLGKKAKPLLSSTEDELSLNDDEVTKLSGLPVPRNSDAGEYLCIALPKEVCKDGELMSTNDYWQLTVNGAFSVRQMLTNEFWRALFAYMDKRREMCANSRDRKFFVIECLESFMERFDIRNSPDQHELQTLKRNLNRKRQAFKYTSDDYIEHG